MNAAGHGIKQLIAGVLGLRGHEADQVVALDFVNGREQIGKVPIRVQVLAVGVHILAQQRDLLIPGLYQLPDLGENLLRLAAALTAADIGHDAVGAEVVAAVHDGYPRPDAALTHHGHPLGDPAVLIVDGEHAAPAGIDLHEQLREFPQRLGAEDQIHMAVAFAHLFRHLRALRHAAAQTDDLLGMGFFGVGQGAQIAENPLFCVVADGTGVQHNDVGLLRPVGEGKAHSLQHA